MKKCIVFVMAAVLAVSMMTGCGSSSGESKAPETTPATEAGSEAESTGETEGAGSTAAGEYTTVEEGKLKVGLEIGYPPMEYFDADGSTPIGFDVELAQALADDMGLELELVDTAWDGIFAGVDTGKYDVVISSVSWTEDRNNNYLLSKTYVANAPVIVVPNESDIADIMDLEGKAVAVQMETTADYLVQRYVADGLGTDLRQYEKVINAFDELKIGRVDAVCTDSVVAAYYLGDEAANYKTVWEADEKEPICMCFKKGNDALKDAMEASLDNVKASGRLGEIATKYFGSDITADLD